MFVNILVGQTWYGWNKSYMTIVINFKTTTLINPLFLNQEMSRRFVKLRCMDPRVAIVTKASYFKGKPFNTWRTRSLLEIKHQIIARESSIF